MSPLWRQLVMVGALAMTGLWVIDQAYQREPLPLQASHTVRIAPGESLQHFLSQCQANGQCAHARWWYWRIRFFGQSIKTGEYVFTSHQTHRDWLARILTGHTTLYPVTFIPGETIQSACAQACQSEHLRCPKPLTNTTAQLLTQRLGWPSLEGQVLPETYHVTQGTTLVSVLQLAHEALDAALEEIWEEADARVKTQLKTPEALLTLASIIEKETGYDLEKPHIAGVLLGRLEDKMRLQVDPSRQYQPFPPWQPADYDTYRIAGLPPTPIALVSLSSLKATAHPKQTQARYYVATRSGHHIFSQTYAQHQKAIAQYR